MAEAWARDQGRRAGPPPHLGPLTCDQGQATLAFGLDHSPAHLIPLGLWPCSPFPGGPLGPSWDPGLGPCSSADPAQSHRHIPRLYQAQSPAFLGGPWRVCGASDDIVRRSTSHSTQWAPGRGACGFRQRRAAGMRWPGRAQRATWQFCLLPAEILQVQSHSWSWGPHLAPPFLAWSTRGWGGRVALNSLHLTPLRGLRL